mgnify:CR=1 FL=1
MAHQQQQYHCLLSAWFVNNPTTSVHDDGARDNDDDDDDDDDDDTKQKGKGKL